jgi:NAD(P)-dependent dehydrogenase (short-subunit alcohol dehydrogenase family)
MAVLDRSSQNLYSANDTCKSSLRSLGSSSKRVAILNLQNKVTLITGGTSGIGAATAQLFLKEGATVIVTGSNPDTLKAARDSMPGIEVIASDAGDTIASAKLIEAVKAKHGRIDVLFANAGIAKAAAIEAIDEAFFDAVFDVNVRGLYFTIKNALSIMPDGSSIILTSSMSASEGRPAMSVYGATKAAVRSLARNLAAELAPRKIRVNAISPGFIETPILGKVGLPPEAIAEFVKSMEQQIPLARIGQSSEVASAALFLATDASSFVTGSELPVDGGFAQV